MDNEKPIAVVRVRQGASCIGVDGLPRMLYSVTLNRPAGDELGIVAAAVDPGKPLIKIPAAGSPHPIIPGFVARCPEIHAVGLREKGGAMVSRESCFYNVVVRYEKACSDPVRGFPEESPYGDATNGSPT